MPVRRYLLILGLAAVAAGATVAVGVLAAPALPGAAGRWVMLAALLAVAGLYLVRRR